MASPTGNTDWENPPPRGEPKEAVLIKNGFYSAQSPSEGKVSGLDSAAAEKEKSQKCRRNPRNLRIPEVRKALPDTRVQAVPNPHFVAQPRALSATSRNSLKSSGKNESLTSLSRQVTPRDRLRDEM